MSYADADFILFCLQIAGSAVMGVGSLIESGLYSIYNLASPFPSVASTGNIQLFEDYLKKGFDINHKTSRKETALMLSSRYGHYSLTLHILSKYGASLHKSDVIASVIESCTQTTSNKETFQALIDFCQQHQIVSDQMVLALCSYTTFQTFCSFNIMCKKSSIPVSSDLLLQRAIQRSEFSFVKYIIEECQPNVATLFLTLSWSNFIEKTIFSSEDKQILLFLASYGLPSIGKFVTRSRVMLSDFGNRLSEAEKQRIAESQKIYQERGNRNKELLDAAVRGDVNVILKLAQDIELQQNFSKIRSTHEVQPVLPSDSPRKPGNTPLILAASKGHVEAVRALLENFPCDVNATNNDGSTALFIASYNGRTAVVEELLRWNPDRNIPSHSHPKWPGKTALEIARINGHHDVVKLLEC